jgi:hypothetical protein
MNVSREQIDADNMVERYVLGQLSEDEHAVFEERLLWDDELRADVDAAEALGAGLKAALAAPVPKRQRPYLAMAAAMVLASGLTLLVYEQFDVREAVMGVSTGTVAYLDTPRSASTDRTPVIEISPGSQWVTLVAYPALDDVTALHITLERSDLDARAAPVWQPLWSTRTDPGNRDSVAVTLRRELLTEGVYRLRMLSDGQPAGVVQFRVAGEQIDDQVR